MTKKKILIVTILTLAVIGLLIVFGKNPIEDRPKNSTEENKPKLETIEVDSKPAETSDTKIIPNETMCSEISNEFVARVTGIPIARMGTINDVSITACNYYLTNESNSPYIAVILNKNLNVETQKSFSIKQKLNISADPRIVTDHYIVTSPKDNRIVNINLIIDPENFIRIDKNVERAIDNEGLLKLAVAISARL